MHSAPLYGTSMPPRKKSVSLVSDLSIYYWVEILDEICIDCIRSSTFKNPLISAYMVFLGIIGRRLGIES